jgi:hypothetical protein
MRVSGLPWLECAGLSTCWMSRSLGSSRQLQRKAVPTRKMSSSESNLSSGTSPAAIWEKADAPPFENAAWAESQSDPESPRKEHTLDVRVRR